MNILTFLRRRSARRAVAHRNRIHRGTLLTLERLESRESPTSLSWDTGSSPTLNTSASFVQNGQIALVSSTPSSTTPTDQLDGKDEVTLSVSLPQTNQAGPVFVAPVGDSSTDEILATPGFTEAASNSVHFDADIPDSPPATDPGDGSGDGSSTGDSGSGGSAPASSPGSGNGFNAAVARWNSAQAASFAFPALQAQMAAAQPPAAPAAPAGNLPALPQTKSMAENRANLTAPASAAQSVTLANPGVPNGSDDVTSQAPGLFGAIGAAAASGGTGDNPVDMTRLLGDVPQQFRDVLNAHGLTTSSGSPNSDPTAVFNTPAQGSGAQNPDPQTPPSSQNGDPVGQFLAAVQAPAGAKGSDPGQGSSDPSGGSTGQPGSLTGDPGSNAGPPSGPTAMPGSGTAPSTQDISQLSSPGNGPFTLTLSVTYRYYVHVEDGTGAVLNDASDAQTTTLTIDNSTPADQAALPAFPWAGFAAPVNAFDAGSYHYGTSMTVDATLKSSSDASDSTWNTGQDSTLGIPNSLSAGGTRTHVDSTVSLHAESHYDESGTATTVAPTADALGMRTRRGSYSSESVLELSSDVETSVTGGSGGIKLSNWSTASPAASFTSFDLKQHSEDDQASTSAGSLSESTLQAGPGQVLPAVVTTRTYNGDYHSSDEGSFSYEGSGGVVTQNLSGNLLMGVLAPFGGATTVAQIDQDGNGSWHSSEGGTSAGSGSLDAQGAVISAAGSSEGDYDTSNSSHDNGSLFQMTLTLQSGGLLDRSANISGLYKQVTVDAGSTESGLADRSWQGNATGTTQATSDKQGDYFQKSAQTTLTSGVTLAAFLRRNSDGNFEGGVVQTTITGLGSVSSSQDGSHDATNTTDATGAHGFDTRTYDYSADDNSKTQVDTTGTYGLLSWTAGASGGLSAGVTLALSIAHDTSVATLGRHNSGSGWLDTQQDATPGAGNTPGKARIQVSGQRDGTYNYQDNNQSASDETTVGLFLSGNVSTAGGSGPGGLPGSYIVPPGSISGSLGVAPGTGLAALVSFGAFLVKDHTDQNDQSDSQGKRTDTISSDVTGTGATTPNTINGVPVNGGAPGTDPTSGTTGSGGAGGAGNATGSATLTSTSNGTSSLDKTSDSTETVKEWGGILQGAATVDAGGDQTLGLSSSGSAYAALFSLVQTDNTQASYHEGGSGGGSSSVTANSNGDTVVKSSSGWNGTYSLAAQDTRGSTYEENGIGLTLTGTLQLGPGLSGSGTLSFQKRHETDTSNSSQEYDDNGQLIRTGKVSGVKLLIGQNTSTLIGNYHVKTTDQSNSDATVQAWQFMVSGGLSAGSPASALQGAALSVSGTGSLSYADINVVDHSQDNSSHEEAGGRSQVDQTKVQQDTKPGGTTSTRTTSNASQDGTYLDTSTSQASEQATAFGGQVSVWGDLGGSLSGGSLSGGQLTLSGGASGSVGWGSGEGDFQVQENSSETTNSTDQGTVHDEQGSDSGGGSTPAGNTTKTVLKGAYAYQDNVTQSYARQDAQTYAGHNVSVSAGGSVSLGNNGISASYGSSSTTSDSQGQAQSQALRGYSGSYLENGQYQQTSQSGKPDSLRYLGRNYALAEQLNESDQSDASGSWSSTTDGTTSTGGSQGQSDGSHTFGHVENGNVSADGLELQPASAHFDDVRDGSSNNHSWSSGPGTSSDHQDSASSHAELHQQGTGAGATYTYDTNDASAGSDSSSSAGAFGSSAASSWWSAGDSSHAVGGPGGVSGSADWWWSNGFTSTAVMFGVATTTTGGGSGSTHQDTPAGLAPLFAGRSFYAPQDMPSDTAIWGLAALQVQGDYNTMWLNGLTFGQIPAVRNRAEQLRGQYGDFVYYTQYAAGAAVPLAVAAAVTVASGGSLAPLIVGGALGATLAGGRQVAQMMDGARSWGDFDGTEIINGGVLGGVLGSLYNCGVATRTVLSAAQYGFAGMQVLTGLGELGKGNTFTGAYDLATAALPFLFKRACFAAGTPIRTPEGSKPIEEVREGDLVLSRDEFDPDGPIVAKRVEEVFVTSAPLLNLHIDGRVIGTTAEHPFYVNVKGWTQAGCLRIGDLLLCEGGRWLPVEGVAASGKVATVYNMRIADFHTYFVGCEAWDFSVWAHNAGYHDHHVASDKHSFWTPRFQTLFQRAGLGLQDSLNLSRVLNHAGRHSHHYHRTVYERLLVAVYDKLPFTQEYSTALRLELAKMNVECRTPGTLLNFLITDNSVLVGPGA